MFERPAMLGRVPLRADSLGQAMTVSVPRRRFLRRRFFPEFVFPYPYPYPYYQQPAQTTVVCKKHADEGGGEVFICTERPLTYPLITYPGGGFWW